MRSGLHFKYGRIFKGLFMAFESDLNEFYVSGEFATTVTHKGSTLTVMFFDVREEFEGVYINHVYFTIPAANINGMIRGDTILRGTTEYMVKSITDHNSDKSIKVVELDFIRETI